MTFTGTESALRKMIAEVVAQLREPITENHRAEADALCAEVVYYWGLLRAIQPVNDWSAVA